LELCTGTGRELVVLDKGFLVVDGANAFAGDPQVAAATSKAKTAERLREEMIIVGLGKSVTEVDLDLACFQTFAVLALWKREKNFEKSSTMM